jgi:manganese efflux pump family protein
MGGRVWGVASAALLAGLLAVGCSAAPAAYRASAGTCFAFGVRALQQHLTVTTVPRACAGLSRAAVNQAVDRAVREVVGTRPKAAARRLAYQEGARLAYLIRTVPRAAPTPVAAAPARHGAQVPLGLAALAAWLVTAAAGGYLLWGWLAHFRPRSGPRRGGGVPPVVILGHFALAVTGLGLWIAFVATGQAVLAWIAAGLLLLIAGLGMATLVTSLPESGPVGPRAAEPVASGALATRIAATAPPRVRLPVTVIALHGALATTTMLLVLLAAIGAS